MRSGKHNVLADCIVILADVEAEDDKIFSCLSTYYIASLSRSTLHVYVWGKKLYILIKKTFHSVDKFIVGEVIASCRCMQWLEVLAHRGPLKVFCIEKQITFPYLLCHHMWGLEAELKSLLSSAAPACCASSWYTTRIGVPPQKKWECGLWSAGIGYQCTCEKHHQLRSATNSLTATLHACSDIPVCTLHTSLQDCLTQL